MHVYADMDTDAALLREMEHSCALYNTRKAARAVTELYEAILAPSGVRATQFPLLVAVKSCQPVSMSTLAQALHTDRTTLTRTLKPLQENGWVEISPGQDRRVQEVRLSAAGSDALAGAVPLWQQAQRQMQERMGQAHWQELLHSLHTVSALKK